MILNKQTCLSRGRNAKETPVLRVEPYRLFFPKGATVKLALKEGDRLSMMTDIHGTLRLFFDSKNGFPIQQKEARNGFNHVIYNGQLCKALRRYSKFRYWLIGDFRDGGYDLTPVGDDYFTKAN